MNYENYETLLKQALRELSRAAKALADETSPATPEPRPRIFQFAPGITWPRVRDGVNWGLVVDGSSGAGWGYLESVARQILNQSRGQPRLILRALRRIQAATAWCRARAEGRRRAAQEILRQQAKAAEALEAEAAMSALQCL